MFERWGSRPPGYQRTEGDGLGAAGGCPPTLSVSSGGGHCVIYTGGGERRRAYVHRGRQVRLLSMGSDQRKVECTYVRKLKLNVWIGGGSEWGSSSINTIHTKRSIPIGLGFRSAGPLIFKCNELGFEFVSDQYFGRSEGFEEWGERRCFKKNIGMM